MSEADRDKLIAEEREKFRIKARRTIEDMDNLMTPEERRNLVRSLVGDYNPLPAREAEVFISDHPALIEKGSDEATPKSS